MPVEYTNLLILKSVSLSIKDLNFVGTNQFVASPIDSDLAHFPVHITDGSLCSFIFNITSLSNRAKPSLFRVEAVVSISGGRDMILAFTSESAISNSIFCSDEDFPPAPRDSLTLKVSCKFKIRILIINHGLETLYTIQFLHF